MPYNPPSHERGFDCYSGLVLGKEIVCQVQKAEVMDALDQRTIFAISLNKNFYARCCLQNTSGGWQHSTYRFEFVVLLRTRLIFSKKILDVSRK